MRTFLQTTFATLSALALISGLQACNPMAGGLKGSVLPGEEDVEVVVAPGAFAITSVTPASNQAQVQWGNSSGATAYTLRYGTSPGVYTHTVSTTAISPATVTGLFNGNTYYFMVIATNSGGSTNATAEMSATLANPPGAFSITGATAGDQEVAISWGASANAASYTVTYGTSTGSYPSTFTTSGTSPTTVTGLTNATTYYFMVTAVNSDGTRDATTEISATPSNSAPSPPSGLSYSKPIATYAYNDANGTLTDNITNNTPTVTGTVDSYSISPNLNTNTGLTFDTTTGVISGKPTLTSAATDYTITATNTGGSTQTIVNIRTTPGFVVDSNGDAGDSNTGDNECATAGNVCTLRAAIQQVNALTDASRAVVLGTTTVTLTSNLPDLTKSIRIVGNGTANTIITGNDLYTMFRLNAENISLTLRDMTLQNANGTTSGVVVRANSGTAITSVTLDTVVIKNSISTDTANSNSGGVVNVTKGPVTITDSSIIDNGSSVETPPSSGTYVESRPAVMLRGAYTNTIERTLFANNAGGALRIANNSNTTTITNSTFDANFMNGGSHGPAVSVTDEVHISLVNNTFSENLSSIGRGAISHSNTNALSSLSVLNTIFYMNNADPGNLDGNCGRVNSNGTAETSLGGNIFFPITACELFEPGRVHADDIGDVDPVLSALADNGGPTETRMIGGASPAIDNGVSAGCPSVDQRGEARPAGSGCDAGAVEDQ
ncbi:MAG TPA: fibronectin type III domain-containing protein [Bdellovibrionota bacterium]|jgi:hypothetical protein|nr:fibronectin type III domain-containing protein [Bdellovibrionota bacterium]